MAARHGAVLPIVETTLADYARLLAAGHGEEDISTIFRLKKPLFSGSGSDG
jgi:3-hydroxyisobutyrate dehydrogenase